MVRIALILCTIQAAFAQSKYGTLTGLVIDKSSGEGLVSANLVLEGTDRVAFADIDGRFIFRNLEAGTYSLVAAMDGFNPTTVKDVVIRPGENTSLNIALSGATLESEMVVTAELLDNTEAGLLKHRQKSVAISDAVSSETMARSGGGNAADAMTKVTGATVLDGKYVFIRGLGDRYTSTHLNGIELPTADPDTNAFQADLFPTGVLDNIVTLKSFTPDKPGNFSGGIIDISTKNFSDSLTYSFSLSTSYQEGTSFNDEYLAYPGSSSDWQGRDNGLRALPEGLGGPNLVVPGLIEARRDGDAANRLDEISKAFEPIMAGTDHSAPLNQGFGLSISDSLFFGEKQLGLTASLSYSRNHSYIDDHQIARWQLTESAAAAGSLNNQSQFTSREGSEKVNWGGVVSASFQPHQLHRVGATMVVSQSGESEAEYYVGQWPEQFSSDNAFLESRILKYSERDLKSYQFRGEHFFPQMGDLEITWNGALSTTVQDEPDTRIFTDNFSNRTINGEQVTIYSISPSIYATPARYYRNLEEDKTSFGVDFKFPVDLWSGVTAKISFGGNFEEKDRQFTELRFEYVADNGIRYEGDPSSYFSRDQVGLIGFDEQTGRYQFGNVIRLAPDTRGGNYTGDQSINAYYGMAEIPVTDKLRTIVGARLEQADLLVTNGVDQGVLDDEDLLPSLNVIYSLNTISNLRFAYGRTLARPTFREKAPYTSFDFFADGNFAGNPDLKRTLMDNFDLRWERFGRPGEIFAASAFYKKFENPIERAYNVRFSSEFGERTFLNVDEATVLGLELEARKAFDFISDTHASQLSLGANMSFIESEVGIPEEELAFLRTGDPNISATRELQGQSPYILNLSINYDLIDYGASTSLFYNISGDRLDEVGVGGAPNAFEQSRGVLDFFYSQPLWKNLSLKFTAKNLLDSPIEILQSFKDEDFIRSRYKQGRTYSLSLSFKP